MDTFDAIYQRRAVKHHDPEHELTDDEIQKLMEAAIQSPTSFNIQNWRFVLMRDKELRQKIRAAANGQAQVTGATGTDQSGDGRTLLVRLRSLKVSAVLRRLTPRHGNRTAGLHR